MIKFEKKNKWIVIVIILILLIIGFILLKENKKTKENVIQADKKLSDSGFNGLYVKEDNKFCVTGQDNLKKENISRDMLWTLELEGKKYKKIEKIDCENGGSGIKIK